VSGVTAMRLQVINYDPVKPGPGRTSSSIRSAFTGYVLQSRWDRGPGCSERAYYARVQDFLRAPQTKADVAYQLIRSQVLSGKLPAGSVLDQGAIAKSVGMSTTPVREALRRLETEELIVMNAHRDARVTPLSKSTLFDLYEARLSLDPLSASLAAQRATDDELATLERTLKRKPRSSRAEGELNLLFHQKLYQASHNPVLVGILDSLWNRTERYRVALLNSDQGLHVDHDEHAEIFEALLRRDADQAFAVMKAHVESTVARLELVVDPELSGAGRTP